MLTLVFRPATAIERWMIREFVDETIIAFPRVLVRAFNSPCVYFQRLKSKKGAMDNGS
ncbi:MAG: hypothetical protein J0G33_13155 [Afipia felis]|nr:hypothetical protein [Afipia felis]